MNLAFILVPYDSGHHRERFGLGPDAIMRHGVADRLRASRHNVTVEDIGRVGDGFGMEVGTGFAICRRVGELVSAHRRAGRFPVILAGNCLTAVGAVAGEGADAIIWFDQHGDLNTPETSVHGFVDGMALASLLGMCWRPITGMIEGFQPVKAERTVLVDARDLDPDERVLLAGSPIRHVQVAMAPQAARLLVEEGARGVHLHLDLDVHEPSDLRVNGYAAPGGPDRATLRKTMVDIARSTPLTGLTITAYDPGVDPEDCVPEAVTDLLVEMAGALEMTTC